MIHTTFPTTSKFFIYITSLIKEECNKKFDNCFSSVEIDLILHKKCKLNIPTNARRFIIQDLIHMNVIKMHTTRSLELVNLDVPNNLDDVEYEKMIQEMNQDILSMQKRRCLIQKKRLHKEF